MPPNKKKQGKQKKAGKAGVQKQCSGSKEGQKQTGAEIHEMQRLMSQMRTYESLAYESLGDTREQTRPGPNEPPNPTSAQLLFMQRQVSQPGHFAAMLNDPGLFEDLPPYLKNNPSLAEMIELRNDPEALRQLEEMAQTFSLTQMEAMFQPGAMDTKEDEKVELKPLDKSKLTYGAACWVCLDDGPDEDGNPLVRDCSCRGSQGYAHLSCIKRYARSKGTMKDMDASIKLHWTVCTQCHQPHQGDLAIALSDACLTFFDNESKSMELVEPRPGVLILTNFIRTNILSSKMDALDTMWYTNAERREHAISVGEDILSLFDKMHELAKQDDPKAPKLKGRSAPGADTEIETCHRLSNLFAVDKKSPESKNRAIGYMERAIERAHSAGKMENMKEMELSLKKLKHQFNRRHPLIREQIEFKDAEASLTLHREAYAKETKRGEDRADTIETGRGLAMVLLQAGRTIESARLLENLFTTSRRVLGPDHRIHHQIQQAQEQARLVFFMMPNEDGHLELALFAVTGYKPCGNRYMLQRADASSDAFSVLCDDESIQIQTGNPVVCVGLGSAAQLNGKIGDIRGRDTATGRYEVHFADQSLSPVRVKAGNLRILLKLPEENECIGDSWRHFNYWDK